MSTAGEEMILIELKKITKLLTLNYIAEKPQIEQIDFLSKFGYQPKETSEILGTSPNVVRVTLTRLRKKQKVTNETKTAQ